MPGIPLLFQKSSLQPHLWKTKSKTGNIWAALNPGRCWEPWGHYQGDQGNATKPTKATPRHGICKVSRLKELRRWSLGPTSELHSRTGTARQGPLDRGRNRKCHWSHSHSTTVGQKCDSLSQKRACLLIENDQFQINIQSLLTLKMLFLVVWIGLLSDSQRSARCLGWLVDAKFHLVQQWCHSILIQ